MSKLKTITQILKPLAAFFSLFIILLSLFVSTAFAQSSTPSTTYPLPPTVSPISPLYTDLIVNNLFHTFSCLAVGQSVIGQPCLSYQITQNAQGMMQTVPVISQVNTSGGVLGTATSLIGMLYTNPPVRTVDYIGSLGEQFGVVKTAHAQVVGSGAAVLNPILRLWQVSRNISYVLMIIIFVIIGIMIMFRHKINPQTVITAQAALPGLVIGLIMITFSFFLAGLISDMAFVGTNVVGYYFSAVRGQTDPAACPSTLPKGVTCPQNLTQDISDQNILKLFGKFTDVIDNGKANEVGSIIMDNSGPNFAENVRRLVALVSMQFLGPIVTGTGNTLAQIGQSLQNTGGAAKFLGAYGILLGPLLEAVGGAAGYIAPTQMLGVVLAFIASLALAYQMVMLLFKLISSYLTIIFLTISAPFQFLFASLPGRQGTATNWILNMLANVLVFPAVLAVLYFVAFLLAPQDPNKYNPLITSNLHQNRETSAIPSVYAADQIRVVNRNTFPLFGGLNLDLIQLILAFGTLIALPSIPGIVIESVGKAGRAGQLIGQEIGGGIRQGQQYGGQFQGGALSVGSRIGALGGEAGYGVIDYDKNGNPIVGLNPLASRLNILQKVGARRQTMTAPEKMQKWGVHK